MDNKLTIALIAIAAIALQGCFWQDDFRAREQPTYYQQYTQYIVPPPRPTLNPESEDYKGDDTHETEDTERNTVMPAIDGLNPIPELPDHPGGM